MVDIIFSLCEALILLSYLSKNILTLRLLSILGMLCYVIGAFVAGYNLPGMMSIIVFSTINFLVNVYQSLVIIFERVPIFLPNNIKKIYIDHFQMMSAEEFNKVYKLAYLKKYKMHEIICIQDNPINELIVVIEGAVRILKGDLQVATLSTGDFVGEMSFIWGGAATASVEVADDKTECIIWNKQLLISQLHDQPELYLKFKQAIAVNLVKKLNEATSK